MSNPFMPAPPQPEQQPVPQQQAPNPFQPGQPAPQQYAAPAPAPQQYTAAPQQAPQQYAPAPQQYAPAPQQYAPQQAPQQYAPAPQYTQQPQQYPQQAPAAPAGPIPVATPGQYLTPPPPSEGGSANMPRIADLQGRLLIVMPERVERAKAGKYGAQDTMTCTVVVLDGGPLVWGGTTPGSQRQQQNVPYVVKGLWIRQSKLVEQLEEALALRLAGGPGLSLGRLWKTGPGQNDPYVLATPNQQDSALYDQYVSTTNPFAL